MAIRQIYCRKLMDHTHMSICFQSHCADMQLEFVLSDLPSRGCGEHQVLWSIQTKLCCVFPSGKLFLEVHYSRGFNPELILNGHFLCRLQISASFSHKHPFSPCWCFPIL